EEAIASYDEALEIKPDKYEAWYNRGNALDDLGRLEEAIASYEQALEIKPDYDKALLNKKTTLRKLKWQRLIKPWKLFKKYLHIKG
ncbi:tetratricopeptide repeat protein, partial [Xenococcus sp. PCC 7305]|uniref:tetratricopeptide repeat protein n=1 Tax=Xenococcus sp. PCC 7305 TaxID=102125 RepID=UPI0002ABE34E